MIATAILLIEVISYVIAATFSVAAIIVGDLFAVFNFIEKYFILRS